MLLNVVTVQDAKRRVSFSLTSDLADVVAQKYSAMSAKSVDTTTAFQWKTVQDAEVEDVGEIIALR
jgi:hypothetical protein